MINKKQLDLLKELSEIDYMEKIGVDNCNNIFHDKFVDVEIKGKNVRVMCRLWETYNTQTIFDHLIGMGEEYKTRLNENELYIYFNKKTTKPNTIKTIFDILITHKKEGESKKVRMDTKENDIIIKKNDLPTEVCIDVPIIKGVLTDSIYYNELSSYKNEISVFQESFIDYGCGFLGLSGGFNEVLTHNTKKGGGV